MGKRNLIYVFLIVYTFSFSRPIFLKSEGKIRLFVSLTRKRGIELIVKSKRRLKLSDIRKKFTDSEKAKIRKKRLGFTRSYYILYQDLKQRYKKSILDKLFPHDFIKNGYYFHRVKYRGKESFWRISVWFTGNGMNYRILKKINNKKSNFLYLDTTIKIPIKMLLPFLRPAPADNRSKKIKKAKEKKSLLEYGEDSHGKYAIYKLKKGEALYSAVVVRFTGRLDADSVMQLAYEIAKRSGIKDVTNIPVGYPVKIPFKYLLPEYLPKDSKEHKKYEQELVQSQNLADQFKISAKKGLEGVYVIIDPGHGGADTGAMYNGVWEDDYMYDIMCRVKRLLEKETKAVVIPTVYDASSKYRVFDREKLSLDRDEFLITTPEFNLNSKYVSKVGVNLRWYLANYLFQRRVNSGVPETNIIFISLHADALYKKVRGAMVYIPYAGLYRKKALCRGKIYFKYYEVRKHPVYFFTRKEVQISEGLSRKFANNLVKSLEGEQVPVHKEKPVREFIFRSKYSRPFVPAVIRNNKVVIKMLVEVANLKNKEDAKNVKNPKFREKVAKAIVKTIEQFYSPSNGKKQ